MKHIIVLLFVLIFTAACSPQTTPIPTSVDQPVEPQATDTRSPTLATTEINPPTQAPTETKSAQQTIATATNPVVFEIIPGESQVSYEVGETFFNENNRFSTAIGVTTVINGEIQVDLSNPQNSKIGTISIDISQFRSDSSRRDGALRDRFLQSAQYPIATFEPITLTGLPTNYTQGKELSFQVTGDLTIRETTLPVTFDVTARVANGTLVGTATTTILLSEFGVGPITVAGILGTEDEAKLTFNLIARE